MLDSAPGLMPAGLKLIEQRPVVDRSTTGSDNNTNQYVLHRQHPAGEMLQRGNPAARLMLFARFVGHLFASRMTVVCH